MKPAAFNYERPADLDGAIRLLSEAGIQSKAVAGSQSLGPMLNLRLAQPDLLVDISAIPEMLEVSEDRDHLTVGACVTHGAIEDNRLPDCSNGLLAKVAGGIAYRAVRNRGTIGGSIAHADPAADWISVLALLGAEAVVHGTSGIRKIPVEDIMVSSFTTVLQPDELIQSIRIPKLSPQARWGFVKFNQKAGEFAHAIGGLLHDPARERFRAVIGAIETSPIVLADASVLFGGKYNKDIAERLDERHALNLLDGKGMNDPYNRQLLLVALRRAAKQAAA
jgi:aerobic carbon-monoxide dehydrogenase medium subunit